jgi:phage terminase small subunit
MNARQQAFVDHYNTCRNATESAKRAGYSERTAYSIGQRLLKHVEVKAAIAKEQARARDHAGITLSQILEALAKIGLGKREDAMINQELKALDLLLRHEHFTIHTAQLDHLADRMTLVEQILARLGKYELLHEGNGHHAYARQP